MKNNKKYNEKECFEQILYKNVTDLLKSSSVNFKQTGIMETFFVNTSNNMAEQFRLDILYRTNAKKNGIPPIESVNIVLNGQSLPLSVQTARKLIKDCYTKYVNDKKR